MLYELSPKILLNIYYYKVKTYLIEIRIKYTNEFHILLLVFAFYHLFNCFNKILQLLEDLINWTSLFYYGQKTSKFIMIPDYCWQTFVNISSHTKYWKSFILAI